MIRPFCFLVLLLAMLPVNAQCDNTAGTFLIEEILLCENESFNLSPNLYDGASVPAGYLQEFHFKQSPDSNDVSVLVIPQDVTFPTVWPGVFYVYSVVGPNDGTGSIDLTDPCTDHSDNFLLVEIFEAPIFSLEPTGPYVLNCDAPLEITVNPLNDDPFLGYVWSDGSTTETLTVFFPGTYSVTVINAAGCILEQSFAVQEDADLKPVTIDSTDLLDCVNNMGTVYGSYEPGISFSYFNINNSNATLDFPTDSTFTITYTTPGFDFPIEWAYGNGDFSCLSGGIDYDLLTSPNGCATITGQVLRDLDDDCAPTAGEVGLADRLVRVSGSTERYAFTDANGNYTILYPANESAVAEVVSDHLLYVNCNQPVAVTVPDVAQTVDVNLFQQTLADCPLLDVQLTAGIVRRCFAVPFYIDYENIGTLAADTATLEVQLDPLFMVDSASVAFTDLGNGLLLFDLGTLPESGSGSIQIFTTLSCDAELGQTLCHEARIYPNDPCPPANPAWNGASVAVSGSCAGGDNQFTIKNVGTGDMLVPQGYIVIEDGVMLMQVPVDFTLPAGDSLNVFYPANGSTFRLEAGQVDNHPGLSFPSFTIEGCGTNPDGTFSTGFVNMFAQDDLNQTVDIECRTVIGAYDPNDKTAFPRGYGDEHFIEPGTPLEYLIRFQNTGTDTAFNVYIEDVLDENLDLTTLRPLISSHDYEVEFPGGDTVHFVFDDILLVDSFTNEPGSHGFIRFAIEMEEDLPLGTVLKNQAGIYFDFNEPIITNEVFHTLGVDFVMVTSTYQPLVPDLEVRSYPQPTSGEWNLTLLDWDEPVQLEILDTRGQLVHRAGAERGTITTLVGDLPAGVYFYRVRSQAGVPLVNGKLLVQ